MGGFPVTTTKGETMKTILWQNGYGEGVLDKYA